MEREFKPDQINKDYLNFVTINNDELVSNWWSLADAERDSFGDLENAFTHFLAIQFDLYQSGGGNYV